MNYHYDFIRDKNRYNTGAYMAAALFSTGAAELEFSLSWWQVLFVLVLICYVVWWALVDNIEPAEGDDHHDHLNDHAKHEEGSVDAEDASSQDVEHSADDLKIIEGIGPKISGVLVAAGINTFDKLGSASPDSLQKLLDDAGIRLGDPTTWPEQAQLAAKGEWAQLELLQESLKGGRRV